MNELPSIDRGYTHYPPSVLIVTDGVPQALELKQMLENNGCQVDRAALGSGDITPARQKYFDLMVLKLEQPGVDCFEMCRKLRANPQLAGLPVVILGTNDFAPEAIPGPKMGCVYYLCNGHGSPGDASAETRLLHIIEQVHYLTYRYI
jgi:DNA-binding response OmpR family regulator